MAKREAMINDLAQYHIGDNEDPAAAITARTIEGCLRYLQRQAETAGMPLTAHLISAAALSALEEDPPRLTKLAN